MRRVGWMVAFLVAVGCTAVGQARTFRGTVIRMRMSECTRRHGFVSTMSGKEVVTTQACPEYTVVTDKVVYVIAGRKPEAFIPLAESVIFHLRKNDLVVISDDEKDESHFTVLEMMLRGDWERDERSRDIVTRSGDYDAGTRRSALVQTGSQ